MAKRSTRSHSFRRQLAQSVRIGRSTAGEVAPAALVSEPSARTLHLIDTIRPTVMAFVEDATAVFLQRDKIAPAFMKAYEAFQTDTNGTFVAFCRLIDPLIPVERTGANSYKLHTSYQQMDYLRRRAAQMEAGPKKPLPASRRPATPLVALARLIQTVLPQIDPNGALWQAFVKEMHWNEKMANRVRTLGQKQGPVPLNPRQTLVLQRTGTGG